MGDLFVTFEELPHENDINLDFYRTSDGWFYSPRRHWCLLAEIVRVDTFLRLRLNVRDRNGAQFQIAIHTEGRGTEYSQHLLIPGNTFAILYAHRHAFLDLTMGIRQEEKQTLQVFDCRKNASYHRTKSSRSFQWISTASAALSEA